MKKEEAPPVAADDEGRDSRPPFAGKSLGSGSSAGLSPVTTPSTSELGTGGSALPGTNRSASSLQPMTKEGRSEFAVV